MNNISKISELFREFIAKYPLNFILLFFLLILEGVVAAATILAIIPFADFLLDPALEDPSRVTTFIVSIFSNCLYGSNENRLGHNLLIKYSINDTWSLISCSNATTNQIKWRVRK